MVTAVATVATVAMVAMVVMAMVTAAHCAVEDTGLMVSTEEFMYLSESVSKYFHDSNSKISSKILTLQQSYLKQN